MKIEYRTRSLGIESNKEDSTRTMQGNLVMTEMKLSIQATWQVGTGTGTGRRAL